MKKMTLLSVLALPVLMAGCSAPSTEVSPQVDGEIRNNLSRELTPDELKMMKGGGGTPSGGSPGSAPAMPPAGKGSKPPG